MSSEVARCAAAGASEFDRSVAEHLIASRENGVESRLDGLRGMVVGEDVWPLGANGVDDVGCNGRWFDGADGVHARADASGKNNADPDRSLNGIEVGPARMVPTVPIRSGTPVAHCSNGAACPSGSCASGPTCGTTDIVNTINATINAGLVPPPAANQLTDILYVVFVPTTFTPFALNTTGTWNGRTYKVAWINGLSGKGFTHELVEAITQNVTVTNCVDTNNPSNAVNQIVDPCGCWFPNQGGVEMAAYWSAIHSACVVADGWAGVWRFNNSPGNWTQISTVTCDALGNFSLTNTLPAGSGQQFYTVRVP